MVMPVVYFNDNNEIDILNYVNNLVPTVEKIKSIPNPKCAFEKAISIAKLYTERNKLLIIESPDVIMHEIKNNQDNDFKFIVADDSTQLCESIANSIERIAAIVVKYDKASTYYYKKVRELSSAEGAVMIWDNLVVQTEAPKKISKKSLPDLISFNLDSGEHDSWLGGKAELIELIEAKY